MSNSATKRSGNHPSVLHVRRLTMRLLRCRGGRHDHPRHSTEIGPVPEEVVAQAPGSLSCRFEDAGRHGAPDLDTLWLSGHDREDLHHAGVGRSDDPESRPATCGSPSGEASDEEWAPRQRCSGSQAPHRTFRLDVDRTAAVDEQSLTRAAPQTRTYLSIVDARGIP